MLSPASSGHAPSSNCKRKKFGARMRADGGEIRETNEGGRGGEKFERRMRADGEVRNSGRE